jgi:hypothetical protein
MDPFMAAVLLRFARLNALYPDTETLPNTFQTPG